MQFQMSTPVKSPEHKRAKGDEGADAEEDQQQVKKKTDEDEAPPKWAGMMQASILKGVNDIIDQNIGNVVEEVAGMKASIESTRHQSDQAVAIANEAKEMVRGLLTEIQDGGLLAGADLRKKLG